MIADYRYNRVRHSAFAVKLDFENLIEDIQRGTIET